MTTDAARQADYSAGAKRNLERCFDCLDGWPDDLRVIWFPVRRNADPRKVAKAIDRALSEC
jgi:hypothetical protein